MTTRAGVMIVVMSALTAHSQPSISIPSSRVGGLRSVPAIAARQSSVDLRELIAALLEGGDPVFSAVPAAERAQLRELYRPDCRPLWLDGAGQPTGNLRHAVAILNQVADDGLDPTDYFLESITRLTMRREASPPASLDLARLDVAVSAGMLRYLRDVHIGRIDPRTIGFRLETPRDQHDFAALLGDAIAKQSVTDLAFALRPPLAQYRLLRSMLPRYRLLATDKTVVAPREFSGAVHPGERYGDVGVLRDELVALDDLPADVQAVAEAGRYHGRIVDGVKHFQTRHGLAPDGVIGRSTLAALRVPLVGRVRQIEWALERLRWLPHLGEERLIALNIPMFRMWAWDVIPPNGAPRFGMDAIVGRALTTQTPVFAARMNEVIFRPYWNVPRSILRHEVLPQIRRNPDYLRRENMEIVGGDGDDARHVELSADALSGLERGVLRVRQRPGAGNALGLIKFVFPNRDDVYMHGTPAQALFARNRRDFSHGCVRVADPVAVAEWVLQNLPEWTRERITAATMGTKTVHVHLPRSIQVILFYTTAAVMPDDGTIRFADDIYRHDPKLERALMLRRTPHPPAD